MAIKESRETVIEASAEEILNVIADLESLTEWASAHRSAEVVETLIPEDAEGKATRVKFDITIDPLVPLPGFVLKRVIKASMDTTTEGLRKRVLSVQKGG